MTLENNIPKHIAIIMDGNGRWAEDRDQERNYGHSNGVDSVREVVGEALRNGVEYLTIYAFSTENWGRPEYEVNGIMQLIATSIVGEMEKLKSKGVKLNFIGNLDSLPINVKESIEKTNAINDFKPKLNLIIAINYSSRDEITNATRKIAQQIYNKTLEINDITESIVAQNLQTNLFPDPDLLIRTSGEQRISNFLLWQISYAELYFTDTLWPDFNAEELRKAIETYKTRNRRYGKI